MKKVLGTLLVLMAYGVNWASLRYMLFLHFEFDPVALLTIVAVIMLIMSVLGGTATISQSNPILSIYAVLLFLLIIVQIFVTIIVFIIHDKLYTNIESTMVATLNNQTDEHWKYTLMRWDYMQSSNLCCCGVHGPKDWEPLHVHGADIETYNGLYYTVPYSCCAKYLPNFTKCYVPQEGCFSSLNSYVSTSLVYFGCIILVAGISELVRFSLIIPIVRHVDSLKIEEEKKREETPQLNNTGLQHSEEAKPLLTSSSAT